MQRLPPLDPETSLLLVSGVDMTLNGFQRQTRDASSLLGVLGDVLVIFALYNYYMYRYHDTGVIKLEIYIEMRLGRAIFRFLGAAHLSGVSPRLY